MALPILQVGGSQSLIPSPPNNPPTLMQQGLFDSTFPFKLQENKVWLEQQKVVVVAKFKFFQLLSRNMKEKNGPLAKMILGRNGKMLGRENVVASLDLKQFFLWVHLRVFTNYSCHIYQEKTLTLTEKKQIKVENTGISGISRVSKTRSLAHLPQFYFPDFRILTHFKSMIHSYTP